MNRCKLETSNLEAESHIFVHEYTKVFVLILLDFCLFDSRSCAIAHFYNETDWLSTYFEIDWD